MYILHYLTKGREGVGGFFWNRMTSWGMEEEEEEGRERNPVHAVAYKSSLNLWSWKYLFIEGSTL